MKKIRKQEDGMFWYLGQPIRGRNIARWSMNDLDSIKQTLADSPALKNALTAFLEAIRQDEKVIEAMIKEREDGKK